jgi:hypothetical protein
VSDNRLTTSPVSAIAHAEQQPISTSRRSIVRAAAWSAPAVMVAGAVPPAAAASPQPGYLTLAGAIDAVLSRPSFNWTWSFSLQSMTIANDGPAIEPGELQLRIRFEGNVVKPPHLQVNELALPTPDPTNPMSLQTSGPGPHAELLYVNTMRIDEDANVALMSLNVQTPETSFPQPGTLIVTASVPGRVASAPLILEVPTDRRVDFDPGASGLAIVDGRRAIRFQGASISLQGPDPFVGGDFLRIRVRFIPDQSTISDPLEVYPARALEAVPNSTLTWTPEFGSTPNSILEWFAETTRRNGTIATFQITDGDWLGVSQIAADAPGRFWVDVWADQRNEFWWDRWELVAP